MSFRQFSGPRSPKCLNCGQRVTYETSTCPQCGYPLPDRRKMGLIAFLIIIVVGAVSSLLPHLK
jgi:predicted amidophosphoribosyltransferase